MYSLSFTTHMHISGKTHAQKCHLSISFARKPCFSKCHGSTVWELRGRRSNYSNLYVQNKSGTTLYTKLYMDAKGARGDEKLGLRIESVNLEKELIT